ncbi:tartrate-resistant acid phosphatase type 5-like [Gigantopelta aegis]|uniref:tartrate-resistant acid phosphatase type 5-like n=1 Tax=Gigantopelta aegis TaxID=1735272 RepID=UPI001B88D12C|nr:tartrate-resistant acid phosphatase type 5-like [Gigantopelta aegis]
MAIIKNTVLCMVALLALQCTTGCFAMDSLRFLVIGDMGGQPVFPYTTPVEVGTAHEMGKIASRYNPQFILELGDNFYYDGVTNVDNARFFETFERVYTAPSLQVPWYLIAGNHDHRGNVSAQIAYSQHSTRWNFPYFFYPLSFKIPNSDSTVDLIMMDTVMLCGNVAHDFGGFQPQGPADKKLADVQWQWVEKMLSTSKADFLLTTGHFPVYSVAEHGPTKCLVDTLLPMLYKYRANGHMSGHDHNLQHLQTSKNGITLDYTVSGSANFIDKSLAHQRSVPTGSSKFHWADTSSLGGFLYIEATPNNMTYTYLDASGKILYQTVSHPRKSKIDF